MSSALAELETPSFTLPASLEAQTPPEARGLARDEVRLLVSHAGDDSIAHARFHDLAEHLRPGDLLVVNESATINAALPARRESGEVIELHLSQRLPSDTWSVELRRVEGGTTIPLLDAAIRERITLPGHASARLVAPYGLPRADGGVRLWVATLEIPGVLDDYLAREGHPIRYGYVRGQWPLSYYQTVFAREPGSAEMPSAGRPFTPRVMERLARTGVDVAPVLLHTGVSSLEDHEPPYAERFRVSAATARRVNETRASGHRVIAVGTTVVRAIESAAAADGYVEPREGWTDLVIGRARGVYAVDGIVTGFHEPRASHLAMLEALAGREHLERTYASALEHEYLWHEFGDVHLLFAGRRDR